MRILVPVVAAALAIALAGCQREADRAPDSAVMATDAGVGSYPYEGVVTATSPAAKASEAVNAAASDTGTLEGGAPIPGALQGRWGLVPADCTSTRGDAKGLLVVNIDSLRFYESTARAGSVSEETLTRMRANFAFSGEGSVWTREMLLEATDGGKTLVRRDFGGDAGPAPITYTRCP